MPARSLGDVLSENPHMQRSAVRERRAFRHGATFVPDWRVHCRALDRNTRARVMFMAEALERRTKKPGRRNGIVSLIGLVVLRALVFHFMNSKSGLLCPSYRAIQRHTGFCRQSIACAIARLETCGVLKIVRRIVRQRVERISPITGLPESYVGTVQTTSIYQVHEPAAYADHLALPTGRKAPFPSPRKLELLERMELFWTTKLSLVSRKNPHPRASNLIASAYRHPREDAELA